MKAGVLEHLGFDAWDKAYMKDLFINRNVNYIETLARSINPENVKMFERIKSYFQFLEIPGDMNRTTMYFNSPKDFSGFMKEIGILASQSPEFVR